MERENLIPNSTQIPHIIIRKWMPRLRDVELRVLLVIADQTLGWIEDKATGRRKEKDWISRGQLMQKTGRGHTKVTAAISALVDKYGIIEALNEQGEPLDTPEKRKNCGMRIYYKLNLHPPQPMLFEPKKRSRGRHVVRSEVTSPQSGQVKKWTGQKVDTTKLTVITKTIYAAKPLGTDNSLKGGEKTEQKPQKQPKTAQPSPHRQFVEFFYETAKKTRGIKPIITAADGRNLKRVLDLAIIDQTALEQLAVYFLAHSSFRKFTPTISTFLSQGILNGLQNRMQSDPNFWQEVSEFTSIYLRKTHQTDAAEISKQIAHLKAHLLQKTEFLSPTERSRAQEEAAAEIRAAKS